jgi:hypothetical protein
VPNYEGKRTFFHNAGEGGLIVDDDLKSLRGGEMGDDDLFGGFSDPADLDFGGTPSTEDSGEVPDWVQELSRPEPASTAPAKQTVAAPKKTAAKPKPKPKKRKARSSGGITPQQRMILSIFLFLDVAVIGCALLIGLGVINF